MRNYETLNIKNFILFHTEDTHKDKIQLYSKDKLLLQKRLVCKLHLKLEVLEILDKNYQIIYI